MQNIDDSQGINGIFGDLCLKGKRINSICAIQRGLGIIEGVASGLANDAVSQLLYTATKMIDDAVKEITDGK